MENTYIDLFNEKMCSLFENVTDDLFQKRVIDAMEYSMQAGGKRVRPLLVYEFCKMCNGVVDKASIAACAIEMIHTASLIHDDLPAMDNDDFRRGKPSCHKAFDEYTAILAGDALITYAFQVLADDDTISSDIKVKLISELSKSTGFLGMIGGQQMDLELENSENVSVEELSLMCIAKTGALIQCACKMGAITAHAPKYLLDKASDYGMCVGLAFQIIDDILDVESTQEVLGKPINSDVEENKSTFVSILGLEESKRRAKKYTDKALKILEAFPDNEFMIKYTKELLNRNH